LGLDSGYLSRVLRSLERHSLISVEAGAADRRVRHARLTSAGRAERRELDRRADVLAWSVLEPLAADPRARLLAALSEVERLFRASMVSISVEDPSAPDAAWCIAQYFAELNVRFPDGFDPTRSIPADPEELAMPRGALLIARLHGRPVGCGALKLHDRAPAELK